MRIRRPLISGFLICSALLIGMLSTAQAQLGIGFGFGSGSWYGPGLWGGGYGRGGGGFYGMGVNIMPGYYSTRSDSRSRLNTSLKQEATKPGYGVLEGYVKLCLPPVQRSARTVPLAAPNARAMANQCQGQASSADMAHVAVVASPYGLNEWVGAQPDATGHYRLTLLPGGYLIQASNPQYQNQRPIEVIVEPGQTKRQDFQIGP